MSPSNVFAEKPREITRALWQAQHFVEQALDGVLAPLGLSTTLAGTLRFLAIEPGLSAAALARRLRLKPQSVAYAIERLEAMKLLDRAPHPEHRRAFQLHLTVAGERALDRATAQLSQVEHDLTHGLSAADRKVLLDWLETLRNRADALLAVPHVAPRPRASRRRRD